MAGSSRVVNRMSFPLCVSYCSPKKVPQRYPLESNPRNDARSPRQAAQSGAAYLNLNVSRLGRGRSVTVFSMAYTGSKSVVVTGGAGFIGSHTCEALLRRGDDVVLVDSVHHLTYDAAFKRSNLEFLRNVSMEPGCGALTVVEGDITDRACVARAMSSSGGGGVGGVVHLAARAGVRDSIHAPEAYINTNVQGTTVVLTEAAKAGCLSFVFGSSSSVYGDRPGPPGHPPAASVESDPTDTPISPYAATKRMGELLAYTYHHLHQMPVSVLRFFTVYGPRGRPDMAPYIFIKKISQGGEVTQFGDGTSWRDYTYVGDVVQGILAALDTPRDFSVYNISAGQPVMLADFIRAVEAAVGRPANVVLSHERSGDVNGTHGDISCARKELGFSPQTSLVDGLAKTVEWYTKEHASIPM